MAKQAASVSLTGGAGFNYEDRVAARFLIDMLSGVAPLGAEFGYITRIDWQVRDSGRLLDDLAITMVSGADEHVAELSIKSHRQVTGSGFPANFVAAAWEEWLHTRSTVFANDRDLLILITGEISNEVQENWSTLIRQVRATTAQRFLSRIARPDDDQGSQFSETARAIFESLHCPTSLQSSEATTAQAATVELLRRVRLLHFDFESTPSREEAYAIADCRRALSAADESDEHRLWETLVSLAAEQRRAGGTIDLPTLLSKLRPTFPLHDHPEYFADWRSLNRATAETLDDIRTEIGNGSRIDRDSEIQGLLGALDQSGVCVAAGESGCGKSSLAKEIASRYYDSTVAIVPEDCEFDRQRQFEEKLGIRHPLHEVLRSSRSPCLVVLDSMERFSERGLKLAGKLISGVLHDPQCDHVDFLLLMQFDAANRVTARLHEAGIELSSLDITQVGTPTEPAIKRVLRDIPGLPWATLHRDMRPLLRNLKILDWVVRAANSGRRLGDEQVTGLIALIEYLWNRWIESDDRGTGGGGVLKKIAALEAGTLESGVPLASLEYAEQQATTSLTSADLLRRRNERLTFSHDLLGDWSRLRILIGDDPTRSPESIQRCAMPRWHRAVRLFGRWLLAQPDGVRRWSAAMARAESGNSSVGAVIRDLMLESLVVSENSRLLLSMAWEVLIQEDGRLLRLLLERFLFVATIPDLRLVELGGTEPVAPQVEVAFRTPLWPYWGAVISTLHEHRDVACQLAPTEVARICKLWMEKSPAAFASGTPYPFRAEAARVALTVARHYQDSRGDRNHSNREARIAYEAVLLSARELPDDVSAFALEVSRRTSPPADAGSEPGAVVAASEGIPNRGAENPLAVEESAQLSIELQLLRGELSEPWADGPTKRVDSAFRKAVLDGDAVLTLAAVRPATAVEVLLAVCIEPPRYRSHVSSDLMDNCGLESWRDHQPAMYFRGPFLELFRHHPDHALTFALKLINFATLRWTAHEEDYRARRGDVAAEFGWSSDRDKVLSVQVPLGHEIRVWLGDRRVFRWYLDWPLHYRLIPCVMMALEKWLYEQIDARREIRQPLERLMRESESVAFAGLLIDVGKRDPRLFFQPLRPLLAVSAFYIWEPRILMERASANLGVLDWWNQPPNLAQLAREWHTAEHRRGDLKRIASWWMLQSKEMQSFFAVSRETWTRELETTENADDLRLLIAQLDEANWRDTAVDGGRVRSEFALPNELATKLLEDADRAEDAQRLITFPIDCRRILDGGKNLPENECPSFLEMAKRISAQQVDGDKQLERKKSSVAGAVAVLLTQNFAWVESDLERSQWCLEQLARIVESPPPRSEFDSPEAVGDSTWDCFIAEAAVGLLRTDADGDFTRELVAFGVMAYHYGTTKKAMSLARRRGTLLADDFERMKNLAIHWSLVRRVGSECEFYLSQIAQWREAGDTAHETVAMGARIEPFAKRWREQFDNLIEQFVKGEVPTTTLQQTSAAGRLEVENLLDLRFPGRNDHSPSEQRAHHRHGVVRMDSGIDENVVASAFAWLNEALPGSLSGRRQHLEHVRDLLQLALSLLRPQTEDDDDDLPNEFDRWTLGVVAKAIVQLTDDPQPSELWGPILSLGSHAHEWIEAFLRSWFTSGFEMSPDHGTFIQRWADMVRFAIDSPLWDPQESTHSHLDDMVVELLGFDFGLHSMAAEADMAVAVGSLVSLYEAAARRWFTLRRVAGGFARSLSQPAYDRILCPGIRWLYDSMRQAGQGFWETDSIESNIVSALDRCWMRYPDEVRFDIGVRTAFIGLLTELASRGNHAVMTFRDRVLDSISGTS